MRKCFAAFLGRRENTPETCFFINMRIASLKLETFTFYIQTIAHTGGEVEYRNQDDRRQATKPGRSPDDVSPVHGDDVSDPNGEPPLHTTADT